MAITNEKLYHAVEREAVITKEMTDIFLELDVTASVTTQAELNNLLIKLYQRLKEQDIVVELFGDGPCEPQVLKNWVCENMDNYTVGLFLEGIGEEQESKK